MVMRTTLLAIAITVGCVLVIAVRVARAPEPTPQRVATPKERAEIAEEIAANERAWEDETRQNFPSDHWSQRDDFHGREFRLSFEIAKTRGIRVEDVLRAIDDDIHGRRVKVQSSPDLRNARAVPCKPRPFYD
jgi:hypothetical protein